MIKIVKKKKTMFTIKPIDGHQKKAQKDARASMKKSFHLWNIW